MKPLYELITARAMQTWTDPINSTNVNLYTSHWVDAARALATEFEDISLNELADVLKVIADQQERFT